MRRRPQESMAAFLRRSVEYAQAMAAFDDGVWQGKELAVPIILTASGALRLATLLEQHPEVVV